MQSQSPQEQARLQRLLTACRRGLNHDLTNQLVAFQGLLQLLEMDELERLSKNGQEYVRRLKSVGHRTLALSQTLLNLANLAQNAAPLEIIALPELVDDILDAMVPPPARQTSWEAPKALAPPGLVRQALATVLSLLAELQGVQTPLYKFDTHRQAGFVECNVSVLPLEGPASLPDSPGRAPPNPSVWHDRLECVLVRELADLWGGKVTWRLDRPGPSVSVTLPAPPMSPGP